MPLLLLLLLLLQALTLTTSTTAPFVGFNLGPTATTASPSLLLPLLRSQQISHLRLPFPAPLPLLLALNSSSSSPKPSLLLSLPSSLLPALASSPAAARRLVSSHILPFPSLISSISLSDDLPSPSPSPSLLLPALHSLHSALSSTHLRLPISAPLPFSLILNPFPPSQAFFNLSITPSLVLPLLRFLSLTSSPLMLSLYPYYSLLRSHGVIPLDIALFKPLPPSREMVDPNTLLHYTNLFDAMIDAAYFAMRNLNVTDVDVMVVETGWPSRGSGAETRFANKENAETYNSNLIKHVLDRSGTPLRPDVQCSVYVYELFNEEARAGPVSERNWGLFYGNGTPVYSLGVEGTGGFLANDTTNKTFCVAAGEAEEEEGVDEKEVQAALDWACGPGRADCGEIQPGEACYEPNDVRSHASYAFDSYYQKAGRAAESCYFQGAAMITTTDPSE